MPKGVEHLCRAILPTLLKRLFSTLMPKGVEHRADYFFYSLEWRARLFSTLMPKGVEHKPIDDTPI